MVSVKISPVGKTGSLARGFPVTVEVRTDAKVSDVKVAIAAKFPRVSQTMCFTCHERYEYGTEAFILVLRVSSKTYAEG